MSHDTVPEDCSIVLEFDKRLRTKTGFSFLRLADGELNFLLRAQTGLEAASRVVSLSCERPVGGPGLASKHYKRLLDAYENCTYLDRCLPIPFVAEHLPSLQWSRRVPMAADVPPPWQGNRLLNTWIVHHAKQYFGSRTTLICGAESALLRELFADPGYCAIASDYFDFDRPPLILQPRNDGASLSQDLDDIKRDIARAIKKDRVETIMLALGGAAKILCYELACEFNVVALDIGAILRGWTYSGSVGYAPNRANHHIRLVQVPFSIYMSALRRAHPGLSIGQQTAKAHAQLCLELQRQDFARSAASDLNRGGEVDTGPEACRRFYEAYRHYCRDIVPMARKDSLARAQLREFRRWRLVKGLGWDGRLFQALVRVRSFVKKVLPLRFSKRANSAVS